MFFVAGLQRNCLLVHANQSRKRHSVCYCQVGVLKFKQ